MLSYAGNSGKEVFYDVLQLNDGTFLTCGYAENLDWINASVPRTQLSYQGSIPNGLGSNRYGFILQFSSDLQTMLQLVHFPQGAVEDIRFMKTNALPYQPIDNLYISCNTADTDNNNGGYIIAQLNRNFVNGVPDELSHFAVVWAKSGPKDVHPWDVSGDGKVYYVSGEAHGYDWSAMYSLDENFNRRIVENWRTHWLTNNTEWYGTASSNPGGLAAVRYSGIALKIWNRCELRSWTWEEFSGIYPDGNGGTRKGAWPADILFNSPCDPQSPTATGPGYTGYSAEACCPVWGVSSVVVDRRNGDFYIGMNFKSYSVPFDSPDFEPAVIKMDENGTLRWWSRLYHEITAQGDTMESLPDQYIDGLAIDYANDKLVIAARSHGNNTENLWEGNTVAANPQAYGFKNQFTGVTGDIHESWLGKLSMADGVLSNCTYVAEMTDATGSLGTPHPDPNLDGWPDPNTGWPNLNTTYIGKNALKVSSSGDVCLLGTGRRTLTTANAYQKMVKPYYGGSSCWNDFVRVYDSDLHLPKYSSLVVGVWDTLTQQGGANTNLYGVYKTVNGLVVVGRQNADALASPQGNPIPVTGVPAWGSSLPENESALIGYFPATNLFNENDGNGTPLGAKQSSNFCKFEIYPNPSSNSVVCHAPTPGVWSYVISDISGRSLQNGKLPQSGWVDLSPFASGNYVLTLISDSGERISRKLVVIQGGN